MDLFRSGRDDATILIDGLSEKWMDVDRVEIVSKILHSHSILYGHLPKIKMSSSQSRLTLASKSLALFEKKNFENPPFFLLGAGDFHAGAVRLCGLCGRARLSAFS